MNAQSVATRLKVAAQAPNDDLSADSLIGIFQSFRPDGLALAGIFDEVPGGEEFVHRLGQLYDTTGDSRRPDAMRDAYFIVRQPAAISAAAAGQHAETFFTRLAELASRLNRDSFATQLQQIERVRVLEGKPPKHPKAKEERVALLQAIDEHGSALTAGMTDAESLAELLRPACYFTACDPFLRDYLLWPLLEPSAAWGDPFAPYFELWKHGIKYRVFQEEQIDLYLPTRADGTLVDAGRFASPERE